MNALVERKIEAMEQLEPITPDLVDWTINDPQALKERLGHILPYFQRVETEATAEPLLAFLPNSPDDYTGRAIHIWSSQEQPHGELFRRLQLELGQTPLEVSPPPVPIHNRILGAVAARNTSIHQINEMLYATIGGMHERTVVDGYRMLNGAFLEQGEAALSATMTKPVLKQEAAHKGYYQLLGQELGKQIRPWQRWVVRTIVTNIYSPVGAGSKEYKAAFGEVVLTLAGEDADKFIVPVQNVADELLNRDKTAYPFVWKAVSKCVKAAKLARTEVLAEAA